MNAPTDLFPESLPAPANYSDDDEARALAWGLLNDKLSTLRYKHSEAEHAEILELLEAEGMEDFVADASQHFQDSPIDFDVFAAGIRHQARRARAAGLVVPDGKPRKRARAGGDATGDLFGDDDGSWVPA